MKPEQARKQGNKISSWMLRRRNSCYIRGFHNSYTSRESRVDAFGEGLLYAYLSSYSKDQTGHTSLDLKATAEDDATWSTTVPGLVHGND
jgi:hypothetical protein